MDSLSPLPVFPGNSNVFKFTSLPPELRLKIWDLAVDFLGPRIIDINITSDTSYITGVLEPALLHVCADSRNALLKEYKPHFTTTDFPRGVLIRPSIDIVRFKTTRSASSQNSDQSSDRNTAFRAFRHGGCTADRDLRSDILCPTCSGNGIDIRLGRYGNTSAIQHLVIDDWGVLLKVNSSYKCGHNHDVELNNLLPIARAFPQLERIYLHGLSFEESGDVNGISFVALYSEMDNDRAEFMEYLEETPQYQGRRVLPVVLAHWRIQPGLDTRRLLWHFRLWNSFERGLRSLSAIDQRIPLLAGFHQVVRKFVWRNVLAAILATITGSSR